MNNDAQEAAFALLGLSPINAQPPPIIPQKRKQISVNTTTTTPIPTLEDHSTDSISCICGFTYDDGFSIACDDCSRWCHAACFDIVEGEVPEEWRCWECVPRAVNREKAVKLQTLRHKQLLEAQGSEKHRRRVSPGVDKKHRKTSAAAIEGSSSNSSNHNNNSGANSRRKRRISIIQHQPPPNEDEHVDIDEPWTQLYVHTSKDIIPNPDTRDKLRRQAQHWRGITAMSPPQTGIEPVFVNTSQPLPPTVVQPLPLSSFANPALSLYSNPSVLPPSYSVHTTTPIPSKQFITPYTSTITPTSTYLSDPLNAYAHLGMPKPFVHLMGPPLDVALDSRLTGDKARFVRSGCRPNAVLRPVLCSAGTGKGAAPPSLSKGDEDDCVTFGVFALRDLKANEEVILGWEWDDGNAVHSLPALIQTPQSFPPGDIQHLRAQMANILHALSSTFATCACGARAKDCVLTQMAAFVHEETSVRPSAASSSSLSSSSGALHPPLLLPQSTSTSMLPPLSTTAASLSVHAHPYSPHPLLSSSSSSSSSSQLQPLSPALQNVDLGPLVGPGVRRGFKTRERFPYSGGMGGVEMCVDEEVGGGGDEGGGEQESSQVDSARTSTKGRGKGKGKGRASGVGVQDENGGRRGKGGGAGLVAGGGEHQPPRSTRSPVYTPHIKRLSPKRKISIDIAPLDVSHSPSQLRPPDPNPFSFSGVGGKRMDGASAGDAMEVDQQDQQPQQQQQQSGGGVDTEDKMPPKMRKKWIHRESEVLKYHQQHHHHHSSASPSESTTSVESGTAGSGGLTTTTMTGAGLGIRMNGSGGSGGAGKNHNLEMPPPRMPAALDPTTISSLELPPLSPQPQPQPQPQQPPAKRKRATKPQREREREGSSRSNSHTPPPPLAPPTTPSAAFSSASSLGAAAAIATSPSLSFSKLSLMSPLLPGPSSSPSSALLKSATTAAGAFQMEVTPPPRPSPPPLPLPRSPLSPTRTMARTALSRSPRSPTGMLPRSALASSSSLVQGVTRSLDGDDEKIGEGGEMEAEKETEKEQEKGGLLVENKTEGDVEMEMDGEGGSGGVKDDVIVEEKVNDGDGDGAVVEGMDRDKDKEREEREEGAEVAMEVVEVEMEKEVADDEHERHLQQEGVVAILDSPLSPSPTPPSPSVDEEMQEGESGDGTAQEVQVEKEAERSGMEETVADTAGKTVSDTANEPDMEQNARIMVTPPPRSSSPSVQMDQGIEYTTDLQGNDRPLKKRRITGDEDEQAMQVEMMTEEREQKGGEATNGVSHAEEQRMEREEVTETLLSGSSSLQVSPPRSPLPPTSPDAASSSLSTNAQEAESAVPKESSGPPPMPTPQPVRMSLKDFALRKKRQREEEMAKSGGDASPQAPPLSLASDLRKDEIGTGISAQNLSQEKMTLTNGLLSPVDSATTSQSATYGSLPRLLAPSSGSLSLGLLSSAGSPFALSANSIPTTRVEKELMDNAFQALLRDRYNAMGKVHPSVGLPPPPPPVAPPSPPPPSVTTTSPTRISPTPRETAFNGHSRSTSHEDGEIPSTPLESNSTPSVTSNANGNNGDTYNHTPPPPTSFDHQYRQPNGDGDSKTNTSEKADARKHQQPVVNHFVSRPRSPPRGPNHLMRELKHQHQRNAAPPTTPRGMIRRSRSPPTGPRLNRSGSVAAVGVGIATTSLAAAIPASPMSGMSVSTGPVSARPLPSGPRALRSLNQGTASSLSSSSMLGSSSSVGGVGVEAKGPPSSTSYSPRSSTPAYSSPTNGRSHGPGGGGYSGPQYIPRGPSADRDRDRGVGGSGGTDWERERTWQPSTAATGRSRTSRGGGAGWSR